MEATEENNSNSNEVLPKDTCSEEPLFLFDSHCHLDRMYEMRSRELLAEKGFKGNNVVQDTSPRAWTDKWAKFRLAHPGEHLECLEGCITVFCHPNDFVKKVK